MARERSSLVGNTLHQIAVTRDEPRVVIDDRMARPIEERREVCLCNRESNRITEALAQRTGGRFHARRVAVLRMPGRAALPLTELLEILERKVIAGQEQQRVEQHRCMARRQNEAIAVEPARILRVVPQMTRPQHVRQRCQRHGRTGMSRVGLLDGVHRQCANGVDTERLEPRGSGRCR